MLRVGTSLFFVSHSFYPYVDQIYTRGPWITSCAWIPCAHEHITLNTSHHISLTHLLFFVRTYTIKQHPFFLGLWGPYLGALSEFSETYQHMEDFPIAMFDYQRVHSTLLHCEAKMLRCKARCTWRVCWPRSEHCSVHQRGEKTFLCYCSYCIWKWKDFSSQSVGNWVMIPQWNIQRNCPWHSMAIPFSMHWMRLKMDLAESLWTLANMTNHTSTSWGSIHAECDTSNADGISNWYWEQTTMGTVGTAW